jgi:hypothetical protein
MQVIVDKTKAYAHFDTLIERWRAKSYPFNRPDAVIPQTRIDPSLRKDKQTLARFYFYACIYMRGGIESMQAFAALTRMWKQHPDLFDPVHAQWYSVEEVAKILKRFIGWDSRAAAQNWVQNSRQLCAWWNGDPLSLIKGVDSYEEACRRMRNKRTKRDISRAGEDGHGFRGFQFKMVSMLLYFYDWEGWLKSHFIYPSPADFHNFRFGFAMGILIAKDLQGDRFTIGERISVLWRELVVAYMTERKISTVEFSDAMWLYSLVLCGNSPLTITTVDKRQKGSRPLFQHAAIEESWDQAQWILHRKQKQLMQTCVVCVFQGSCKFAIPANPYYQKGKFVLRPRPTLEHHIDSRSIPAPVPKDVIVSAEIADLLGLQGKIAAE